MAAEEVAQDCVRRCCALPKNIAPRFEQQRRWPRPCATGRQAFYVAPASNGGTIKLVGNTMVVVHMLTVVDGRYIGGEVGIEGALFPDIIAGDEVKNAVVVTKRKNLLDKQFDAYFSMRLMLKDLCLAGDMASHWTTPLPGLALGTYLHQIGCHLRESQQDLSAFRAIYRKLAG